MSALSPVGTARKRFLQENGESGGAHEGDVALPVDVEGDDFEPIYLGWEIARCARGLAPQEGRAIALLSAACIASVRDGSTRLPLDEPRLSAALARLGGADAMPLLGSILERVKRGEVGDPVTAVVGLPGERKPLVLDGEWLYTERMRGLEDRFCARIRERLAGTERRDARALSRACSAVSAGPPPLTEEQKRAVREALSSPLALISGAPGTGKTTIVVALLRALAWMGEPMTSVAIAAPTGKAAQRLRETMADGLESTARDIVEAGLRANAPTPQTLHRLLGWSPSTGRFARHENDRLPNKWVVIDEASMVDLSMMDRLLRALGERAHLVLLGDADQLPSVDAGAVFRDLCAALRPTRLSTNLRVAREPVAQRIVVAAQSVNTGELSGGFAASMETRRTAATVTFEGVEHLAAPWAEVGDELLERWWHMRMSSLDDFARTVEHTYLLEAGEFDPSERAELRTLLDHHARFRILCATRVQGAATSTQAINERLLTRLGAVGPRGFGGRVSSHSVHGIPVVVERNDYERDLYNGDQGLLVRMGSGPLGRQETMAVFRQGSSLRAFPADALVHLSPCFAMTVHKAQGSEFDSVVLVLPEVDLPLVTRELVYTAMTRARRSVLIVGREELLVRAVSRTLERHSGISERVRDQVR
jgi:exodeoxyribonuclease V alpha subunit